MSIVVMSFVVIYLQNIANLIVYVWTKFPSGIEFLSNLFRFSFTDHILPMLSLYFIYPLLVIIFSYSNFLFFIQVFYLRMQVIS